MPIPIPAPDAIPEFAGFGPLYRRALRSAGHAGRLVRRQPWLKVAVILFFAMVLVVGLFALFYAGFLFLSSFGGAGLMIVQRLFALFFFGLGIMLVFSSVVTSYATIFRSEEIPYLLMRPCEPRAVVLFKSLESALLSSWAFFFMILPFVGAYTVHERLSWLFFSSTLLFSVPFVLLCSFLGTIACLLIVRWFPRPRVAAVLLAVLAAAIVVWFGRQALEGGYSENTALVLTRLVPGMKVSSWPLWPSWWVSEGIIAFAGGRLERGFWMLGVLLANLGLAGMIVEQLGARLFVDGWRRIGLGTRRARRAAAWSGFEAALRILPRDTGAIVLKDLRTFLRDPVQWSQAVIFFGLLAIYFVNVRNMRYHVLAEEWRRLIVFINMLSVSSVVASLSSRFVYPQMSLEGQSFWIVGLSPVPLRRVLRAKFWTSAVPLAVISAVLMVVSAFMLGVPPDLKALSGALAICIALAIAGFSTGLGTIFIDLRQRNPAAIVSSFGGTLNLVFCMGFTFAAVLPFATLYHLEATGRLAPRQFHAGLVLLLGLLALLTALSIWLPLRLGRRGLETREYGEL